MNDNPLFDSEPAAPAPTRPRSHHRPLPPGRFLIFIGCAVFAICLIAGLVMYVRLENERRGERDEYGNRRHRDPDPYAEHYFPGCLTLLMGSVQGLVIFGLGLVVNSNGRQRQPHPIA